MSEAKCGLGKHKNEECALEHRYTTKPYGLRGFVCTVHQQWYYNGPVKTIHVHTYADGTTEET